MTREEAITVLKGLSDNPLFSEQHKAAFNIAIHDIKQRHDWDINNLILINKENYEPQEPKSEWEHDHEILRAYSDGVNNILDKMRAEIEHHRRKTQDIDPYDLVGDCLDIIDKYKAESEE